MNKQEKIILKELAKLQAIPAKMEETNKEARKNLIANSPDWKKLNDAAEKLKTLSIFK